MICQLYPQKDWERIRGKNLGMVFSGTSIEFKSSMRCGHQVLERLQKFEKRDKTNIDKVIDSFNQVQLPDPKRIFKAYPSELSGGKTKGYDCNGFNL